MKRFLELRQPARSTDLGQTLKRAGGVPRTIAETFPHLAIHMTSEQLRQARLQTVRDHMALECEQDWDGVIATFAHPRYEMYGNGQVYDGEAEVRAYFAASRSAFPDQKNEIIALAADDAQDTVLVEFYLTGTHLGELRVRDQAYAPTGRSFKVRMAASFQFAPGSAQIVCERPYTSPDLKLRALGLA